MKTFNTFSELENSTQNKTGAAFTCSERANEQYILESTGYAAVAGDVTFANNRVGARQLNVAGQITTSGLITSQTAIQQVEMAMDGNGNKMELRD